MAPPRVSPGSYAGDSGGSIPRVLATACDAEGKPLHKTKREITGGASHYQGIKQMKKLFQIIGVIACSVSLLSAGSWGKEETYSTSSKFVRGVMDNGFLSVSRSGDKYYLYSVKVRISEGMIGKEHIDVSGKPYLNGNFPITVDISFDDGLEFAQTWQADVANSSVYAASQPEAFINAIRKAKKLKLVIRHDGIAGQYEFDVIDLPEFGVATQTAAK
jgi:hypothetical protein